MPGRKSYDSGAASAHEPGNSEVYRKRRGGRTARPVVFEATARIQNESEQNMFESGIALLLAETARQMIGTQEGSSR